MRFWTSEMYFPAFSSSISGWFYLELENKEFSYSDIPSTW